MKGSRKKEVKIKASRSNKPQNFFKPSWLKILFFLIFFIPSALIIVLFMLLSFAYITSAYELSIFLFGSLILDYLLSCFAERIYIKTKSKIFLYAAIISGATITIYYTAKTILATPIE